MILNECAVKDSVERKWDGKIEVVHPSAGGDV